MSAKSPSRSRRGSKAAVTSAVRRSSDLSEAVRVVVRCRPLIRRQVSAKEKAVVQCVNERNITLPGPKSFAFDQVFDENTKQREVYDKTAAPLVGAALDGYNGTVFAYGQTGSGKTFTMDGDKDDLGIMRRAFSHIFEGIEKVHLSGKQATFLVRASFVQIYQEQVYDLLTAQDKSSWPSCPSPTTGRALEVREDPRHGFFIQGVTSKVVRNAAQCVAALDKGTQKRITAETAMNAQSSRSHTVFSVTIEREDVIEGPQPETVTSCGVLNFVDLAGSENLARSKSEGLRKDEACYINSSLTALNNTIRALVANARTNKQTHIPYRDSTLTKILRESLGGTARCVMVANISPSEKDTDETASTLWHAHSAKEIQNKPTRHTGVSSISRYKLQIASLKEQLALETCQNEARIAELTQALMVPTFVESLAERWSHEAGRGASTSEREGELTAQLQSMTCELEQLKQQLEVASTRGASEGLKLERDLTDAKNEIAHLRNLNNEQSATLAKMESEHLSLLAENQKLLDRTWKEQQPACAPEGDASSLCLQATEQQLQQALSRLESEAEQRELAELRLSNAVQQLQAATQREREHVRRSELQEQDLQQMSLRSEQETSSELQRTQEELCTAQERAQSTEEQLQRTLEQLHSEKLNAEQAEKRLEEREQAEHSLRTRLEDLAQDKEQTEQQLLQALSKLEGESVHRREEGLQLKQAQETQLQLEHTHSTELERRVLAQEHTSEQLQRALNTLEAERRAARQTEQQLHKALARLESHEQQSQKRQQTEISTQPAAPLKPRNLQEGSGSVADQARLPSQTLLLPQTQQSGRPRDRENRTADQPRLSKHQPMFNPVADSFEPRLSKGCNSHRFFEHELRRAVEAEMHGITHMLKTELRSDLSRRNQASDTA